MRCSYEYDDDLSFEVPESEEVNYYRPLGFVSERDIEELADELACSEAEALNVAGINQKEYERINGCVERDATLSVNLAVRAINLSESIRYLSRVSKENSFINTRDYNRKRTEAINSRVNEAISRNRKIAKTAFLIAFGYDILPDNEGELCDYESAYYDFKGRIMGADNELSRTRLRKSLDTQIIGVRDNLLDTKPLSFFSPDELQLYRQINDHFDRRNDDKKNR